MITVAYKNSENESEEKEKRDRCLAELKKQIKDISDLKNIWTGDNYLLRFLYSTDFDVDKAFIRMKEYLIMITECSFFYAKCGPLDIKDLVERRIITVLPDCDREGRTIVLFKPVHINTSESTLPDIAKLDDIWLEYAILQDVAMCGKGLCYITDVKYNMYGFVRWFNIRNLRMSLRKIANLPLKDMVIHVVNRSFPVQCLGKVADTMMSESSRKQVKFHFTNWASLHEHIDPKFLPEEYGGSKEINYSDIYRKFYSRHVDIVRSFELSRMVEKVDQEIK